MRAFTLSSTLISRIAYDDAAETLRITFRSGSAYLYFGVPRSIYDRLKAAESPGRFYNQRIKGRYGCIYDPDRKRYRPDQAA